MRPGQGNAQFIADAHSDRVSLAEMRSRWVAGDYGNLRKDYATGWLALAGKEAK